MNINEETNEKNKISRSGNKSTNFTNDNNLFLKNKPSKFLRKNNKLFFSLGIFYIENSLTLAS